MNKTTLTQTYSSTYEYELIGRMSKANEITLLRGNVTNKCSFEWECLLKGNVKNNCSFEWECVRDYVTTTTTKRFELC